MIALNLSYVLPGLVYTHKIWSLKRLAKEILSKESQGLPKPRHFDWELKSMVVSSIPGHASNFSTPVCKKKSSMDHSQFG